MQARTAIAAAALGLLAACGGGGGGGAVGGFSSMPAVATPAPEAPKSDCSVALYGDSILHGAKGLTERIAEPPAAAIKRLRPAYTVIDHTVSGDSATLHLGAFLNDTFGARLVVIQYGINDAGNGWAYEAPLRAMVQRVKSLGKLPIVTGLSRVQSGSPVRDEYDAIARKVAAEEGATFADWGAVEFDPADMQDDVHPGPRYSTRLSEQLVIALDLAAPECK